MRCGNLSGNVICIVRSTFNLLNRGGSPSFLLITIYELYLIIRRNEREISNKFCRNKLCVSVIVVHTGLFNVSFPFLIKCNKNKKNMQRTELLAIVLDSVF